MTKVLSTFQLTKQSVQWSGLSCTINLKAMTIIQQFEEKDAHHSCNKDVLYILVWNESSHLAPRKNPPPLPLSNTNFCVSHPRIVYFIYLF